MPAVFTSPPGGAAWGKPLAVSRPAWAQNEKHRSACCGGYGKWARRPPVPDGRRRRAGVSDVDPQGGLVPGCSGGDGPSRLSQRWSPGAGSGNPRSPVIAEERGFNPPEPPPER